MAANTGLLRGNVFIVGIPNLKRAFGGTRVMALE
jgi:hypothetical protein